jgi:adenosylmethionine-8-amino-7-oxononanoate aminotransferase
LAARIEKLGAVAEVRQQGLMVGVELAPPGEGLRWGRKVCAAAVARGVLLRPLGDVVVLMPILTSTAEEIERIVDVLAESIAEATSEAASA